MYDHHSNFLVGALEERTPPVPPPQSLHPFLSASSDCTLLVFAEPMATAKMILPSQAVGYGFVGILKIMTPIGTLLLATDARSLL